MSYWRLKEKRADTINLLTLAKTVLITGGSEGMGLAVAKKLSAKGANVVLVARNTGKLEEALKIVQVRRRLF